MHREFHHGDCQFYVHALQVVLCSTGPFRELRERETSVSKRKMRESQDVTDCIGYYCKLSEKLRPFGQTEE